MSTQHCQASGLDESIRGITQSCLELLQECIANTQDISKDFFENKLADLRLWAHGLGFHDISQASTIRTFTHRSQDLQNIEDILSLLRDVLKECILKAYNTADLKHYFVHIEACTDSLSLLGNQVKRTWQHLRLRDADLSFLKRRVDYRPQQEHFEIIIKALFSDRRKSRISKDHSTDQLNVLQARLVEANLRRCHRFAEARQHYHKSIGSAKSVLSTHEFSGNPGFGEFETPQDGILLSVDDGELAPAVLKNDRSNAVLVGKIEDGLVRCPCCYQSLPMHETEGRAWESVHIFLCFNLANGVRRHLSRDLAPYSCIIKSCPLPFELFVSQDEWHDHVLEHHKPQWCCPCCDDSVASIFTTLSAFVGHISSAHNEIQTHDLAYVVRAAEHRVFDITECPLCDVTGARDSDELISHVLQHVHDFSMSSLPWRKSSSAKWLSARATFDLQPTVSHVENFEDEALTHHEDFMDCAYSEPDAEGESDHEYPTIIFDESRAKEVRLNPSLERIRTVAEDRVGPMSEDSTEPEEEEDSDYNPRRATSNRPRRIGSRHRPSHGGRVTKTKTRKSSHGSLIRPFPCALAQYGCGSTFRSKNEWKRHVSTHHIKIGFWRCDMCSLGDPSNPVYNDFNRKDLFTQHLRRMHRNHPLTTSHVRNDVGEEEISDEAMAQHQERCYIVLRSNPQESTCLFTHCDKIFEGDSSWELRMEHVGAHMEKDRKANKSVVPSEEWREDIDLRDYLKQEGLIEYDGGRWYIGDGKPKRDCY